MEVRKNKPPKGIAVPAVVCLVLCLASCGGASREAAPPAESAADTTGGEVIMAGIGAGWLYPKVRFSFKMKGAILGVERLETPYKYEGEMACFIRRKGGNSFRYRFYVSLFTRKVYRQLHIVKMGYHFEGKSGTLLEDATFLLPDWVVPYDIFVGDNEPQGSYWVNKGNFYWLDASTCGEPMKKGKGWPRVNFGRIFKDKKAGNVFDFTITCVYRFDEEEEKTIEFDYQVVGVEGEFTPFWMGW